MAKKSTTAPFGRGLLTFLAQLAENNDREWFQENRERFVADVEEPMLRFIGDVGDRLRKVSRRFVADPRRVGGSMYRIYRDVRFSKDKSPYKTHVAAHFRHEAAGKDESVPGFYLHLQPGESMAGGGIYHPQPEALKRIRDRIVAKPREWQAVRKGGLEIQGEALRRAPAGYDTEHPFVEDLKRKDLYSLERLRERDVCAADFADRYVAACARVAPLMQFLTRSLGLPW